MPIKGLSEQRRLARDFKVRLGTRLVTATKKTAGKDEARGKGESYPTETDFFVLEEAPDEVKAVYAKEPKSLRVMLGFEWDQTSPTGEDLVFSLFNRAYGNSKGLKCRGTGQSRELPGQATTSDEAYALRIERATKVAPKKIKSLGGDDYFQVACIGRDCPLFLHKVRVPDPTNPARTIDQLAPGHDSDASCNEIAILRCFLLHPSVDPKDEENYCRVLGTMELATTSIHSIIDLMSGFDLIKPFTAGRTAGIPMTLIRKPTETFRPVRRTHFTCAIHIDHREAQRWAAIPLAEVFLSETQRSLLKQLQETPLGLSVDSVRDLIPRRLPGSVRVIDNATLTEVGTDGGAAWVETPTSQSTVGTVDDPRIAPGGGSDGPAAPPDDPATTPLLVAAQLDELKQLAGGPLDPEKPQDRFHNPWKPEALERLRGAIVAMRQEMGIEQAMALSELRIGHYEWLKVRLRSLPPLEPPS